MSLPDAVPTTVGASSAELPRFLAGRRITVLAGAGCSTESGIPDYRGPRGSLRTSEPMRYQEFMGSGPARARYWSRSMVGWPRFSSARPNRGHRALARLEDAGIVAGVITQNVDGLHRAAGSRRVVDLHGDLARVRCTACDTALERWAMQARLTALNPGFESAVRTFTADGDAELQDGAESSFRVPSCEHCGGILKPDVVFFGEKVPAERVERAWQLYEEGEVLMVVGSSLAVFSGRRFVLRAQRDDKPVAIVNLGPTRGDEVAALKVEGRLGQVLPELARVLCGEGAG